MPSQSPDSPAVSAQPAPKPRHAVILAAGEGVRLQERGDAASKVLIDVAGLSLIERAVLTLEQAGVRHFRIVLGSRADDVRRAILSSDRLQDIDIEFRVCPSYSRGNGVSLAAGVEGLDAPFLVAMGDHVFSSPTISDFVREAALHPECPQLATDTSTTGVFDIDDATKVVHDEQGHITALSKTLDAYNGIDSGLFYFPAWAAAALVNAVEKGATSVSEAVLSLRSAQPVLATALDSMVWQDVDTPSMAAEAERRLLKSLVKPTDGWASRVLNRPVSLFFSKYLSRWGVRPNSVTTGVFLISMIGSAFACSTDYLHLIIAGLIFQLASILDGCDGEVARLTFTGSRYGAWYDTLSDNVRYGFFFAGLGVSCYRSSGNDLYLWAIGLFSVTFVFAFARMAHFVWNTQDHLTNLAVTAKVEARSSKNPTLWDRIVVPLRGLIKQDVIALVVLGVLLLGQPQIMFWVGLVAIVLIAVSVVRVLDRERLASDARNTKAFMFYAGGLALLGVLVSRLPFEEVAAALHAVGGKIVLAFAVAPLWFVANALSLSNLIGHKVPFRHLLYNQLVGEAFNSILPLAGLGGEPYKVNHLRQWLSVGEASHAVVHDRLVHGLAGVFYSATMMTLAALFAPLEPAWVNALWVGSVIMIAAGLIGSVFTLSRAPTRLMQVIMHRFEALRHLRPESPLAGRVFALSVAYKLLGRAVNLVEIWVIVHLLGLAVTPAHIVLIAAVVSASGLIFFVVPQGLGVSEAGITGAFAVAGLGPNLGLAFGLVRRARILFWACAGLSIHVALLLYKRLLRPAAMGAK